MFLSPAQQLRLLIADPAEPGDRIGAGHLQARARWRDQRDAPAGGYTDRWTCLMFLRVTAMAISPRWIVSVISNPAGSYELEERQRDIAVAIEQRKQRVQHLRFARLVTLPARRRSLSNSPINLQGQLDALISLISRG